MTHKKTFIITAVGAGGKSTYLHERALEYVRAGKKAAITTTTHIWRPEKKDCASIEVFHSSYGMAARETSSSYQSSRLYQSSCAGSSESGHYLHTDNKTDATLVFRGTDGVDTIGVPMDDGRLSAPSYEDYRKICAGYDAVLVEGDGSRCMPVKIPGPGEPVIPEGTGEIAVVMGTQAAGRRLDIVCHRYDLGRLERAGVISTCGQNVNSPNLNARLSETNRLRPGGRGEEGGNETTDLTVTDRMLERIAEEFYIKPLRGKYPGAKVFYAPSPYLPHEQNNEFAGVTAVLMASGFGRRYGGNKLLEVFDGRPLYRHALDHITEALGKDSALVVTQYDEIITQTENMGIRAVKNNDAAEGISASIRIGTEYALGKPNAVVIFFAADMPYLSSDEIRRYVRQFLWSGKTFGCMEYGPEHIMTNPGSFRLNRVPSPLAGETCHSPASGEPGQQIRPAGAQTAVSGMLLSLTGDMGAMRIMKKYPQEIYRYQVPAEEVRDIDVRQQ